MNSDLKAEYGTVDGLRIRYADSGGPASQHLVLTSPWPESLYAFDRMWPRLSGLARLLAIDLPGFGQSERRAGLLAPAAMGEFLIRVLDEWDIRDPHLVCPDVGTPAALFAAARHPGRIRSLVVGGAGTAWPLDVAGTLKDLIDAPDIDAFRSLDPQALIDGLVAPLGPAAPDGDIIADYVESSQGDRFAESARYVRSYPGLERRVPPHQAAQQPARRARRRASSLGRGARRVRLDRRRLGRRRLPGGQRADGPRVTTAAPRWWRRCSIRTRW